MKDEEEKSGQDDSGLRIRSFEYTRLGTIPLSYPHETFSRPVGHP